MSSGASEARLIGIDWGTSSLRAFLIDGDGEVLDRVSTPQGIMQVKGRDFEAVFQGLVAPWIGDQALPIIASGMITSRNGWRETPYIQAPAGADELARNLVAHQVAGGFRLWFVTGLSTEHDGAPDVMRGEETQIVGATGAGIGDGVFVMPGTHSKWVSVVDKRIEDFATYMTGEIFAALRSHTILGTLMAEGPFSEAGFQAGVVAGMAGADDLLHRLFSVRTLPLFGRIDETMIADYLSGLLIGAEIRAATRGEMAGSTITIVGRGDLADRYAMALSLAGLQSQPAPENIVARGHFVIARAAGLLS